MNNIYNLLLKFTSVREGFSNYMMSGQNNVSLEGYFSDYYDPQRQVWSADFVEHVVGITLSGNIEPDQITTFVLTSLIRQHLEGDDNSEGCLSCQG